MVPSPPPGTVNQRPPLPGRPRGPRLPARPDTPPCGHLRPARAPGQTLRAAGRRGAPAAARARPLPAPNARPLTFHGGEQRQQQQRGPQPPQGHGCASRCLGPRRRGARAARAGARAQGSGGQGERRGAAHTQPPPPRSQQNEPSSPGRTGTRAPPALGTAHLSRGRGGSPTATAAPHARPGPQLAARGPRVPVSRVHQGTRGQRRRWSAETLRAGATETPGSPRAVVVSPGAVAPPDKAAISAQMFLNFY